MVASLLVRERQVGAARESLGRESESGGCVRVDDIRPRDIVAGGNSGRSESVAAIPRKREAPDGLFARQRIVAGYVEKTMSIRLSHSSHRSRQLRTA